jgi:hypothetical protein
MLNYIFFAKWFGIVSAVLSMGILANLDDAKILAKNLIKNETGYIMGGVLPIIFGSLAFLQQPHLGLDRQSFLSVIGIGMTLLGSYRVLFVDHWRELLHKHADQIPALFSLFGLMFGVVLLYIGYISPIVRPL